MSTNSEKDAEALTALELANSSFIASDGYRSTRIYTNAQAAEKLLESDWLAEHDRAVRRDLTTALDLADAAPFHVIQWLREHEGAPVQNALVTDERTEK